MTARLMAAIAVMLCAEAAAGAELGRMFFTPAQRVTLDNARKQNIRVEIGSENQETVAAPVPQNVSVNGLVRRSDGKSTVWLNNRALTEPHAGGMNVAPGRGEGGVRLTVPESGRSVDLKVGQTVEIVSGTIEEGYRRRAPPKSEGAAPAGSEKTTSDAAKVTPDQPSKADEAAAKRAARNKELDLLNDLQRNSGAVSK